MKIENIVGFIVIFVLVGILIYPVSLSEQQENRFVELYLNDFEYIPRIQELQNTKQEVYWSYVRIAGQVGFCVGERPSQLDRGVQ